MTDSEYKALKASSRMLLGQMARPEASEAANACSLMTSLLKQHTPELSRKVWRKLLSPKCMQLACLCGNLELIEYLITVCQAKVERRFPILGPQSEGAVRTLDFTYLMYAALTYRPDTVRLLVKHGANVNATTDDGLNVLHLFPLYWPSYNMLAEERKLEMVELLIDLGADINHRDHNGMTCLMKAVEFEGLFKMLIEKGADLDAQDSYGYTALHYAITISHALDRALMLLEHGAKPCLKNIFGIDALQAACIWGFDDVIQYLEKGSSRPRLEEIISGYELLGAYSFMWTGDVDLALAYWRRACDLRLEHGLEKCTESAEQREGLFSNSREFESYSEVEELSADRGLLEAQCYLIWDRVLGLDQEDLGYWLKSIMQHSVSHGRAKNFVEVTMYILKLECEKNSLLSDNAISWANDLLQHTPEAYDNEHEPQDGGLQYGHFVDIIDLLLCNLAQCSTMVTGALASWELQSSFDDLFLGLVHFLDFTITKVPVLPEDHRRLRRIVKHFVCEVDLRNSNRSTLLHESVYPDKAKREIESDPLGSNRPSISLTRFILECGADVEAEDANGDTPLHNALYDGLADDNADTDWVFDSEDDYKDDPNDNVFNEDLPEDDLEDLPEDDLEDIPEDDLEDIPEDDLEDIPEDDLEDIPEDDLEDIPDDDFEIPPEDFPEDNPEGEVEPEASSADYTDDLSPVYWKWNYKPELVELLLAHGAHMDHLNARRKTPWDRLMNSKKMWADWNPRNTTKTSNTVKEMHFTSLQCLAARVVANNSLNADNRLPERLRLMVDYH